MATTADKSLGSWRKSALIAAVPPADAPRPITLGTESLGAASNIRGSTPNPVKRGYVASDDASASIAPSKAVTFTGFREE